MCDSTPNQTITSIFFSAPEFPNFAVNIPYQGFIHMSHNVQIQIYLCDLSDSHS